MNTTISLRVSNKLLEDINKHCKDNSLNRSEVIRKAVEGIVNGVPVINVDCDKVYRVCDE